MSVNHVGQKFPEDNPERIQLNDESDFYQLLSPDGYISICGYASLLAESSARTTIPDLINFRVAKLHGFHRVFANTTPIFFECGIAKPETKEFSGLCVEPCEGQTLVITIFEIQKSEIPAFIKREHGFRFLAWNFALLASDSVSSSLSTLNHQFTLLSVKYPPIHPSVSLKNIGQKFPANKLEPIQLNDEADFEQIVSSDGLVSICGFASLLSENSARTTFPDLVNFRVARLNGFRRVFCNATPIFLERGIAKPETKEISSSCVEPCEGGTLIVTVFEIKKSQIPEFIKREPEFRFLAVLPETLDGKPFTNRAVVCARSTDEDFFNIRCKGSKEIFFQYFGRYNIDKVFRDDILPCRVYLRHIVLAAKNLGDEAYNNFLDHSFLGDRKTTIREYLATTGAGIMEEEPPESLKIRYGG